tara:strand:- start:1239 stop:1649 length:411 start_codon:yes stop_codon:yes gene_type:complete
MSQLKLNHIGIVVKNLEKTADIFNKTIGLSLEDIEDYKETLRIGFLPIGSTDIELIEPISSKGINADFLKEQGEGIHHIAFEVDSLDQAIDHAVKNGAEVIFGPTEGARSKRIVFLKGDIFGGTIIELLESNQSSQ